MGSILSQAAEKCYRQAEKSGPGEKQAHKPEFMASYERIPCKWCRQRVGGAAFLDGKTAFAFLFATKIEEIRSKSPQRLRNTRSDPRRSKRAELH
jgi:hypothetical protein